MAKTLLFVYGTLKKGGSNQRMMGDSIHLGTARLEQGTTLYTNGGFPMMVETVHVEDAGVWGELYEVDEKTLKSLDRFEGHPNHFQRRPVGLTVVNLHRLPTCPTAMQAADKREAQAYFYNRSVEGREQIGNFFPLAEADSY